MKKVKTFTFDPAIARPVTLRHVADDDLIFKSETENFNFGLQLKAYNVLEDLKDRKSNSNSAYFLSDLQSLSSILRLETPYEFVSDSKFTTYIKLSSNYIKAENASSSLSYDSNFNYLDSKYFFTINLSTNRYLYITKQIGDDTYYAYCSSESVYLSSSVPGLSSHLFEYVLENNNLKLYPHIDLDNPLSSYQVILSNTLQLTSTSAGNTVSSVFDVSRNTLTKSKGKLNNALTFYLSGYNNDSVEINLNTTTNYVSNNYLGFTSIYSLDYCDKKYNSTQTIGFDVLPLKNQTTVEEYPVPVNHYNSQPDYLNREYEKIQSGSNEEGGYDKIYLSYNTGTKDIHFPPSRLTYFTTPSSLSPYTILNINDSKIDSIGAIASNRPQMADKVYKRRLGIKNNNFTDDINATYLCSWLSGNEAGEKLWVDRYYNPDAVDYNQALTGTAFYNTVTAAGAQNTYMFDISSRLTFETNNDYAYYHIGERDYSNHITSFDSYNLAQSIETQTSKGANVTVQSDKGDSVIELNGDTFGKFITDYKGDACCSFWLSANDYSKPFAYKILGNYFEDGFGIFNTDFVTPNLFIPVGNKLLLLNTELEIYDEIEVLEGTTPVNIKGIARKDNFSDFYVLGENNVIYVYNSNPNLVSKIDTLSGVSNLLIEDIDVTNNRIYVAFNPSGNKGYYYFDFSNNKEHFTPTVSSETYGDKVKIYANPNTKNVTFLAADSEINTGNEIAVDSNNEPFTIRQKLPTSRHVPFNIVYKNAFVNNNTNVIEVSGGNNQSVLTNVIVDDEDYVITIHDGNRISKLKNTRELILYKDLTFLTQSSTKYLDVILDFEQNVYKKYYLIVEKLSNKTLLHKIDKDFNLVKTKNLGSRLINSLELTKSITSFYYLKKYNADKNKLKVLLKTKPKFTTTGTFKKIESKIVFDISQLNPGYNHFAVNISLSQGWMDLYVNGKKFTRTAFTAGTYLLDNPFGSGFFIGALSTPYYLTLASRLQLSKKYFVKNLNIKGFKLYKRVLDNYEIRSIVNYHGYNKDTVWSLPIGQRSYIDTIDRVFKFGIPERNTNYFEVDIKNININNAKFRNELKNEIAREVNKLIPYYDVLRNVRIDEGIVNKDFDPGVCDVIIEDRIKIKVPGVPEKQVKTTIPEETKYYCEVTSTDGKNGRIRNTPHDPSDPLYGDVCCLLSPYNNVFRFEYRECPPVIIPNFHEECWSENSQEGAVYKVNDITKVGELIYPIEVCCKSETDKNLSKTRNFTDGNCPTKEDEKDCTKPLIKNDEGICVCPNGGHLPVDGECTGECIDGRTSISKEVCCIDKDGVIQVGESRQHLCDEEPPPPECKLIEGLEDGALGIVYINGEPTTQFCCGQEGDTILYPKEGVTEHICGCPDGEDHNEDGTCERGNLTTSEFVTVVINLRFIHNIIHNLTGPADNPENANRNFEPWPEKVTGQIYKFTCETANGLTAEESRGFVFCNTRGEGADTKYNIEVDYFPEVLTTRVSVNGQIAYTSQELTALNGNRVINASIGNAIVGQATTNWDGTNIQGPDPAGAGFLEISLSTTSGLDIKRMLNTIAGLINVNDEVRFYSVGTYKGMDYIPETRSWEETTFFNEHGGSGTTIDTDPTTTESITLSEIIQSGANAILDGQYENGARINVEVIAKELTLASGGVS